VRVLREIKVTLFNIHGITSHIELSLQYNDYYYTINQWSRSLQEKFSKEDKNELLTAPSFICSKYSFSIIANPEDIISEWKAWHSDHRAYASPCTTNCADAVQWFLTRFAGVPKPKSSKLPLSLNHLIFGITVPSFFKTPMTLPGRVIANAKFHIEQRYSKEHLEQYAGLKTIGRCNAYLGLFSVGAYTIVTNVRNPALSAGALYALGQFCTKGIFNEVNHYLGRKTNERDLTPDTANQVPLQQL
jgi:hypothetical protein